jgi:enoyl-CoA hydratase/carnithine racemase
MPLTVKPLIERKKRRRRPRNIEVDMSEGEVRIARTGAVAHVTFDRAAARNAMTWHMYQQLAAICAELQNDAAIRVVVFRGAGGKAFIAGTDIAQFKSFTSPEDGVKYEHTMEQYLVALEALPMPTIAVLEGWAVGGGLAIASCCDLRVATPGTRHGVPIARTLGNCLSMENVARLVAALGPSLAKRMLILGDMVTAEEAKAAGYVLDVVEPAGLDARVTELCDRLARNAPITMRVSKEAIRRLQHAGIPGGDDLVRQTYGSDDFRDGVRAFVEKREAQWTGR